MKPLPRVTFDLVVSYHTNVQHSMWSQPIRQRWGRGLFETDRNVIKSFSRFLKLYLFPESPRNIEATVTFDLD